MKRSLVVSALCLAGLIARTASATPLLVNGGFETGNFTGWTVSNQVNGNGNWFVDTPGTTAPQSGLATNGTGASGSFYAVSDQTGPGTHVLQQSFTVTGTEALITLSFDMFVNDWDGGPTPGPLDFTGAAKEYGRVDIMANGASAFSTTPADIVQNLFSGADAGLGTTHPFTHYSFNLTGLAAGTYSVRFAEVDNQSNFTMGVDNVNLDAVATPEPATLALLGSGLLVAAARRRRRR